MGWLGWLKWRSRRARNFFVLNYRRGALTMAGMAATAVALLAAFDPLTEGIRNLHDSGNPANMRTPLATLAALLDSALSGW
jgi:hypothetical protein